MDSGMTKVTLMKKRLLEYFCNIMYYEKQAA